MEKKIGMSSFTLKTIAIIAMAVDHTGAALFPEIMLLRIIGRIAFPIFAFLIVQGFFHTNDIKKYLIRLFLFALISEIPFDMAIFGSPVYWGHQNVFFTLFLGLLAMYLDDYFRRNQAKIIFIIIVPVIAILCQYINADYGMYGILIIIMFYWSYIDNKKLWGSLGVIVYVILRFSKIRIFTLLALPLIYFYNGKQGYKVKYLFYVFYPLHLLIIAIIRLKTEGIL